MTSTSKFKKPTCRGSYQLGTACGHCERCAEETARKAPQSAPTAEQYAAVTIGMEIAQGLTRSGESPMACAEKIVQRLKDNGIVLKYAEQMFDNG